MTRTARPLPCAGDTRGLPTADDLLRMPYDGADVPHAVIEVNQKCNISCRACYKDKLSYTKPLALIKQEIDLVASRRNLRILSLAGGEPTLHPELPEVIRYITSKGIDAQILSNGLSLTDEMLQEYQAAGLSTIYLHIDSLQRRPDAKKGTSEAGLNPLRKRIGAMVARNGIHCALSMTLYQDNLPQLPEVIEFVLSSPDHFRLLCTLCTDFGSIGRALNPEKEARGTGVSAEGLDVQGVSNAEVKRLMADECDMLPFAYVASSRDLRDERWLLYYAFTVHRPRGGYTVVHAGPEFRKVIGPLCALSKRLGRPMPFGQVMGGVGTALLAMGQGVAARDPRIAALLSSRVWPGARLRQKSIVFQQGPNVGLGGNIEFCKDCPDATVRDGKVVPVCMVDALSEANRELLLSC